MHTSIKRSFYLFYRYMLQNIKAILEYQSDFFILMSAAVLTQVLGFIFIWVVFRQIPDIHGWTFWEVVLMYAMLFFATGCSTFFFEGTWRLSSYILRGGMDIYLIRPVSPILQVLSSAVGMNGLGNLTVGAFLIVSSLIHVDVEWTIFKMVLFLLFVVSGVVIRTAINLAANCIAFWLLGSGNPFSMMVSTLGDFAKFPISIYSIGIKVLISVIIPFSFIGYVPASFLFGKEDSSVLWGLLCPLAALYCMGMAVLIFHRGLKKYESVGN
ncbi:ABC-2 family transporter protein [Paenibacillus sp. HB172176]|uniref:ABC transporter permease n=1 Tax=Paenibacillus sp. HB172176 TaxID=2493690 RepID=UPI001F0F6C16|nr:ABC-2 family transporter protein [Paenibacillus sp. HB172176]